MESELIDIEMILEENHKKIFINGIEMIVFKNSKIYIKLYNKFKLINNIANSYGGYNRVYVNRKKIYRHRIMAHVFLKLDINDKVHIINHIDNNKLNNDISNLKVVKHLEKNEFSINSEGYIFDKITNKFIVQFVLNDKMIKLGLFNTESRAKAAYDAAKLIHHMFN